MGNKEPVELIIYYTLLSLPRVTESILSTKRVAQKLGLLKGTHAHSNNEGIYIQEIHRKKLTIDCWPSYYVYRGFHVLF